MPQTSGNETDPNFLTEEAGTALKDVSSYIMRETPPSQYCTTERVNIERINRSIMSLDLVWGKAMVGEIAHVNFFVKKF